MAIIKKATPGEMAAKRLQLIYTKAEQNIIKEITRKRTLGLVDYADVTALNRVQEILRNMVDESGEYIPIAIKDPFYKAGDLESAPYGYYNAQALSSAQTAIVERLVDNLLADIEEAANTAYKSAEEYLAVGRLEAGELRNLALELAAQREAEGKGWNTIQNKMAAELTARGITSFVDKAGRKWNLSSYCAMATRTTGRQAQVAAALTADDWDLWQISQIGSTCPLCSVYEGRVYSKSGTDPDYPPLAMAFGKIDTAGSNDLSNTWLNIHPNCLHSLVRYTTAGKTDEQIQRDKDFSSFTKRPANVDYRSKKQIAAYRDKEKARAAFRSDMKQFKKYQAALGNDFPKTFETFMKHKKAGDEVYKEWEQKFREISAKASQLTSQINTVIPEAKEIIPKKAKVQGTMPAQNITQSWTISTGSTGKITKVQEYAVDGVVYKVDGHNVIFKPSEQELRIAEMLAEKYGKKVELLPRVNNPQKISTPDYLVNGERFDLKSPKSNGEKVLYNLLAKKKKQAPNFIIDISHCGLSYEEVEKQVADLYTSTHTRFIDKIVIVKNDEVIRAYKRN